METVGRLITVISGLLRLISSGCLPVWMLQSNGAVWSCRQNLSCVEILQQEWADWGAGWLSRVKFIHLGIALFSTELPHPGR